MADKIVSMTFCKNEADILQTILDAALPLVDSMFIADDGSTDGSWEMIQDFKKKHPDKVEHIQQRPDKNDQGQRNTLLKEIRNRYKPEKTWVQMIEADIILHTTDLRATIAEFNREDVSVGWHNMNAVREHWEPEIYNQYPNWSTDIREVLNKFHWLEEFPVYTYRPLPDLFFSPVWRPWPKGFSKYHTGAWQRPRRGTMKTPPLTLHYGYRGPKHMAVKFNSNPNPSPTPLRKWGFDFITPEKALATFHYFNGTYNRNKHVFADPVEAWFGRG